MENDVVLYAENIYKSFPGVKALSDVSFDLKKGEVLILLGENGAGKSTLMKIISGLYSIDSGKLYIDGKEVHIKNTQDAQKLGISIIYQEFNLVPDLTVAQNIFLHREPRKKNGNIDKKLMNEKSAELLAFLNAGASPDDIVRDLGVAQQQLVEVAKALSQNAKILILDEPTATLSEKEIQKLFETIRDLKAKGVSMVYISHRLQEIKQIGDRVTVLRDGMTVGTRDVCTTELDELIKMMVGRTLSHQRVRVKNTSTGEIALEAKHINRGNILKDVSINVKKGEIVAVAGLVGAGRTELMHAIYGIDKIDSGEVFISGEKIKRLNPHALIKKKLGLLPESRKESGLALILPITQNITQAALGKVSTKSFLSLGKEKKAARKSVESLKISCSGIGQTVVNLSGGNQQKVVLGKWLFTECGILIFDEPTRGIDVGTRAEIYNIMNGLAEKGVSILVVSSDLPEVMTIADRIYVMREGRIVAELDADGITQETVIAFATGGKGAHECVV